MTLQYDPNDDKLSKCSRTASAYKVPRQSKPLLPPKKSTISYSDSKKKSLCSMESQLPSVVVPNDMYPYLQKKSKQPKTFNAPAPQKGKKHLSTCELRNYERPYRYPSAMCTCPDENNMLMPTVKPNPVYDDMKCSRDKVEKNFMCSGDKENIPPKTFSPHYPSREKETIHEHCETRWQRYPDKVEKDCGRGSVDRGHIPPKTFPPHYPSREEETIHEHCETRWQRYPDKVEKDCGRCSVDRGNISPKSFPPHYPSREEETIHEHCETRWQRYPDKVEKDCGRCSVERGNIPRKTFPTPYPTQTREEETINVHCETQWQKYPDKVEKVCERCSIDRGYIPPKTLPSNHPTREDDTINEFCEQETPIQSCPFEKRRSSQASRPSCEYDDNNECGPCEVTASNDDKISEVTSCVRRVRKNKHGDGVAPTTKDSCCGVSESELSLKIVRGQPHICTKQQQTPCEPTRPIEPIRPIQIIESNCHETHRPCYSHKSHKDEGPRKCCPFCKCGCNHDYGEEQEVDMSCSRCHDERPIKTPPQVEVPDCEEERVPTNTVIDTPQEPICPPSIPSNHCSHETNDEIFCNCEQLATIHSSKASGCVQTTQELHQCKSETPSEDSLPCIKGPIKPKRTLSDDIPYPITSCPSSFITVPNLLYNEIKQHENNKKNNAKNSSDFFSKKRLKNCDSTVISDNDSSFVRETRFEGEDVEIASTVVTNPLYNDLKQNKNRKGVPLKSSLKSFNEEDEICQQSSCNFKAPVLSEELAPAETDPSHEEFCSIKPLHRKNITPQLSEYSHRNTSESLPTISSVRGVKKTRVSCAYDSQEEVNKENNMPNCIFDEIQHGREYKATKMHKCRSSASCDLRPSCLSDTSEAIKNTQYGATSHQDNGRQCRKQPFDIPMLTPLGQQNIIEELKRELIAAFNQAAPHCRKANSVDCIHRFRKISDAATSTCGSMFENKTSCQERSPPVSCGRNDLGIQCPDSMTQDSVCSGDSKGHHNFCCQTFSPCDEEHSHCPSGPTCSALPQPTTFPPTHSTCSPPPQQPTFPPSHPTYSCPLQPTTFPPTHSTCLPPPQPKYSPPPPTTTFAPCHSTCSTPSQPTTFPPTQPTCPLGPKRIPPKPCVINKPKITPPTKCTHLKRVPSPMKSACSQRRQPSPSRCFVPDCEVPQNSCPRCEQECYSDASYCTGQHVQYTQDDGEDYNGCNDNSMQYNACRSTRF